MALGGSLALLRRDLLELVMAIEAQNQAEALMREPLKIGTKKGLSEFPKTLGVNGMEPRRLELLTPCMPCRCSTS